HRASRELLRRHVTESAQYGARSGDRRNRAVTLYIWRNRLCELGQAEIKDVHVRLPALSSHQENVLRLQVAVHDTRLVRGFNAFEKLVEDIGGCGGGGVAPAVLAGPGGVPPPRRPPPAGAPPRPHP